MHKKSLGEPFARCSGSGFRLGVDHYEEILIISLLLLFRTLVRHTPSSSKRRRRGKLIV